jgi:hypothetical protein
MIRAALAIMAAAMLPATTSAEDIQTSVTLGESVTVQDDKGNWREVDVNDIKGVDGSEIEDYDPDSGDKARGGRKGRR